MKFSVVVLEKLVNKKTMTVCSALGAMTIPYWMGRWAGRIEADTIHAVFQILEHKKD